MNFLNIHSPWLLLLMIPTIIFSIIQFYRKSPTLLVSNLQHFTGNTGSPQQKMGILHLPLWLETAGIILLVIAVARPQFGRELQVKNQVGIDMTLCLDISKSMDFFDPPTNLEPNEIVQSIKNGTQLQRIDIAKEALVSFIDDRHTDRLGLIVFATQPYQICPLTTDRELLKKSVAKINTDMLGVYNNSTGLAAPLTSAIQRLKNSPAKRRVIILFTDGVHNATQELTPAEAVEIAKQHNIIIHTVGIGSNNGYAIVRDSIFNRSMLQKVDEQFDEKLLQSIAAETNGVYYDVKSGLSLKEIMKSIDKLEKIDIENPRYTNYKELYPWFLSSGSLLICLAFILSKTVLMRLP